MPLPPDALRRLPSVDSLLRHPRAEALSSLHGRERLLRALRETLDGLRRGSAATAGEPDPGRILEEAAARLRREERPGLRRVINATGVVLHTNLGRAPMSAEAASAAREAAAGYLSLEYDLETGERGRRGGRLEEILCALTGAEAALAVNNNAAAVLLALNSLSEGRETVISRGELVEIGGSFRIPEVLGKSHAILREVGTTNRTHLRDYREAVGERTGAILKVHPSNYRIEGFTAGVTLEELAALARDSGVPLIYDLGGGALFDTAAAGLAGEPEVRAAVDGGADVVCFSGDKLIGGPQAGYVVGRRGTMEALRKNPLRRALRLDKMSLAAAEVTLLSHFTGAARGDLPVLRMLHATHDEIAGRAEELARKLREARPDLSVALEDGDSTSGGGSAPDSRIRSRLVAVSSATHSAAALEAAARSAPVPVVARVQGNRLLLDLRTVLPGEEPALLEALTGLPRVN